MNLSESLGYDALRVVLGYLGHRELRTVSCVSKDFYKLSNEEELWHVLVERMIGVTSAENYKKMLNSQLRSISTWKGLFRALFAIETSRYLPRPGMVFELKDTFGLWTPSRVIATVGSKILMACEGWGDSWQIWIHRFHDREKVRPLSQSFSNIGPDGNMSETEFNRLQKNGISVLRDSNVTLWPSPVSMTKRDSLPSLYSHGTNAICCVRLKFRNGPQDEKLWLDSQQPIPFESVYQQALHPPPLWPSEKPSDQISFSSLDSSNALNWFIYQQNDQFMKTTCPPQIMQQKQQQQQECGPVDINRRIWFCKGRQNGCCGGTIYGIDVYSNKSNVCQAALQSGAISTQGGHFQIVSLPGLEIYPSGNKNSIVSQQSAAATQSFFVVDCSV